MCLRCLVVVILHKKLFTLEQYTSLLLFCGDIWWFCNIMVFKTVNKVLSGLYKPYLCKKKSPLKYLKAIKSKF